MTDQPQEITNQSIVIRRTRIGWYMLISATSKDDTDFIEKEAPLYGDLHERDNVEWPYALIVNRENNPTTIAKHLVNGGRIIDYIEDTQS